VDASRVKPEFELAAEAAEAYKEKMGNI